jgi:ribosomal-protein-alanine N-acetyltransferase
VTVSLRRAAVADLPLIWRGERAYMREIEPEHEAAWAEATERHLGDWLDGLDRTLVAEVDGEPAGYAAWAPRAEAALLTTIHVFDRFRGTGLGGLLLRAYLSDARTFGFSRFTLGAHRDNPARRLYERNGFEATGVNGDYVEYARQ